MFFYVLINTYCIPLAYISAILKNPYLSALLCVFVISASPLRNFNEEPTNYLNSYANVDTDDSMCNHK